MNAQFAIRVLELAEPIRAPRAGGGRLADDGTAVIFCCKSEVRPKDLEPPDAAHFAAISLADEVPAGRYLFLQVIYDKSADEFLRRLAENEADAALLQGGAPKWIKPSRKSDEAALVARASKELWLESLWLEAAFKGCEFFLRLLEEGEKRVFQLFREIKAD